MIILCFFSISAACASEVNNDINIETLSNNVESTNLNGTQSGVVHSIDNESVTFVDHGVNDSSSSITYSDDKNNASFDVPDTEIAQGKNESFNVTLTDDGDESPLSNQTVSFIVNNITYNRTTDANGIAGLHINLVQGNYTINYSFSGNDVYNSISGSCTLEVIPVKNTTVSLINSNVFKGNNLTVSFSSEDGPLSNQSVSITVNNKTYNRITDENGIAKLTINLNAGYYTVNCSYNGSRFFNPSNNISNISVIDGHTVTNMAVVNSTVFKGSTFQIILSDGYGNRISNGIVSITVNNRTYNRITDENGIAKLTINLFEGNYNITYEFNGNESLNSSNGSIEINVIPKEDTQLSGLYSAVDQGDYYKVTLCDSNNTPIANQTVSFTVNNITYIRTTDANGTVSLRLNLNFGYYEIISTYNGSDQYNGVVISNGVLVLNSTKTDTNISVVELFVKNSTENKTMVINVTSDNGTPLSDAPVNLFINGKEYNKTTNVNGTVSITIRLNTGLYDVQIRYAGNDTYNPSMAHANILSNGTFLTANRLVMGYKDGSQFVLTLLNATGNPIANETVHITINGITYNRTTDENGIARLNINLRNGTYDVNYTYPGSEKYPANTSSSQIVVENRLNISTIIHYLVSEVYPYIVQNHHLPGAITMDSVIYSLEEYMYILASTIVNINNGSPDYVVLKDVTGSHNNESLGEGTLSKENYLALANKIITDVNSGNSITATYSTPIGDISFDRILYGFTKVIDQYDNTSLPEVMEVTSLVKTYDTSTIAGMAGYLTDGLSSDYDKAKRLFEWVRDKIEYQYYSNSLKGASGAFTSGRANCCDQSNLLVAMARSVGLNIVYRHYTNCYFNLDAAYYGHVWTQFTIDGQTYQADPCSTRNSFGKIVNFNYDTVSGSTRTYTNLPF